MRLLRSCYGVIYFLIWDDAFMVLRLRFNVFCDVIIIDFDLVGVIWICITFGNMVKFFDLVRMRAVGCVVINFGLESGDAYILCVI